MTQTEHRPQESILERVIQYGMNTLELTIPGGMELLRDHKNRVIMHELYNSSTEGITEIKDDKMPSGIPADKSESAYFRGL